MQSDCQNACRSKFAIYFREWLIENYPDRYRVVFKLVRDTRGGKDYDSTWGERPLGPARSPG